MSVEVRYFASLADFAGTSREVVDTEPGDDVGRLWVRLTRCHPELAALSYRPAAACDLEYASWDRVLDGVREVAFLPPVSGG